MARNILNRVIQAAIVMLGVALLIFIMLRIVPGNAIVTMMGEHAKLETIERMTRELGLDQPIYVQFWRYISDAVRGDFGTSYPQPQCDGAYRCGVSQHRSPRACCSTHRVGDWYSLRYNRRCEKKMGYSTGSSWACLCLVYLYQFSWWQWCCNTFWRIGLTGSPISGVDSWTGYILPAIALGWNSAGSIARLTRSTLLEVMQEDYIDTARAKGHRQIGVIIVHALRNALLPVITMMAVQLSSLLSGAVICETVFSVNGIGRLLVQAIEGRDIPLLQGTILFLNASCHPRQPCGRLPVCRTPDPRISKEV